MGSVMSVSFTMSRVSASDMVPNGRPSRQAAHPRLAPGGLWRAHAGAAGAMTDAIASFPHPA